MRGARVWKRSQVVFPGVGAAGVVLLAGLFLASVPVRAQVGHILEAAGPINHSMAGAATGNPVDPCGALYWNPAGLSRLKGRVICLSAEEFKSHLKMSSSAPFPGGGWGTEHSHMPLSSIPTGGMFINPEDTPWAFAFGLNSVAGFGVNFDKRKPGSGNPILYPQGSGGFGGINSEYQLAQLFMGASRKMNDHLSLGFDVLLAYARLEVDPFPGAAPTAAGYSHVDRAGALGYGFNMGILYDINSDWSVGLAYRTTVDFESFNFGTENPAAPDFSFDMDLPSVLSAGIGYNGLDRWKFDVDVRKINYDRTDGFAGDAQFAPNGAVRAFGWDSVWMVAFGMQYQATKRLTVRAGYAYNTSPVRDAITFYNVASPAIIQHHVAVGFTYRVSQRVMFNLAYMHGFRNSIEGPMYNPATSKPIPGTRVKSDMSTDSLVFGIGWFF